MRDDETPAEMSRRQALKTMAAAPVIASIAAPTEPRVLAFKRPAAEPVEPLVTLYATGWNQAGCHTAITRVWPTGTTPARCGRCPLSACSLINGVCMVLTGRYVADDAVDDFRLLPTPAPK